MFELWILNNAGFTRTMRRKLVAGVYINCHHLGADAYCRWVGEDREV